ncbi:HNH endonuclease signature motif containing protein [Parendozoicomonas sp. Alg238-R29]|uniref:HNH endonuclease signature motif containing protein n=1 Tax=Parendozoicomonas sp. Alg238-R29 TaxID=2993446 RepID=UPI00248D8570|nr:HNH endonuclease signature motif containing protein [Parendozoicomonas sp. Alg238-R29]
MGKGRAISYSQAELDFIKANCQLPTTEQFQMFQERFNRPDVSFENLNSLRKRNGWLSGRTGQFEKGNIPSPNARPKGPNKTSFKKGSKPANWKPVGSERISKDGYIEIKVAEGMHQWRLKHLVEWEKDNGPLPDGFCLIFRDRNKTNTDPSNLELISRNANLQINRLRCSSMPEEVQPTVRLIGKLNAQIYDRKGAAA